MPVSKAKYGSVKTVDRNGKLYLDFRYQGNRFRTSLNLVASNQNSKAAKIIASQIELDIATNQFDSTLVKYLGVRDADPLPTKLKALSIIEAFQQWRLDTGNSKSDFEETERFLINSKATWETVSKKLEAKQYAPRTHNRKVQHLNALIEWFNASYKTSYQPLKKIKGSQQTKDDRKPFTDSEIELILEAIATDRFCSPYTAWKHSHYLNYCRFLFLTGCRPGEVVGLKRKHFDLTRGTVEISESLSKASNYNAARVQKSTKTGSVRVLPLPKQFLEDFLEVVESKKSEDYVFTGHQGKPIDHSNFSQRVWKPILEGLGIPYRVPYASRHTMASRAIEQGIPLTGVAYLMGHSDTTMVSRRYAHMINRPSLPTLSIS